MIHLMVIPLVTRIAAAYFSVVAVALVADVLIVDGAAFRAWPSFAVQAVAAFALGFVVLRGEGGLVLCSLVAAGVLAGGFFPDSAGYSRRAPEPFVRMLLAIVPAAVAAYLIVRTTARPLAAASSPAFAQEPLLTGTARYAATKALELLDACEEGLAAFERRPAGSAPPTRAEIERLWAALDGYEVHLRVLPIGHPVSNALQDGVVAYIDATTLTGFVHGAHAAMEQTPESARQFTEEVAARRGVPGTDAAPVAKAAREAARAHRARATEMLHATRFSATGAQ